MILVNTDNDILEYIGNFENIPLGYIDVSSDYIGDVETLNLERFIYQWNGVDDFFIFDDKLENIYDEIESEIDSGTGSNFPLWKNISVSKSDIEIINTSSPTPKYFKNSGGTPSLTNCLNFISTRNSRVTISSLSPTDPYYDFENPFSIEFWFKRNNNTQDWKEILRKNNVFEIGFAGSDQLYFQLSNYDVLSEQLVDGIWHHIVMVCNPTIGSGNDYLKVYYNGSLVFTSTFFHPNDNNNDIQINRERNQFSFDNFVIWEKELSDSEILQSYNSGSGIDYDLGTIGIVSLWKCNETSGNVLTDSILGNDGIIQGTENSSFEWVPGVINSGGSKGILLNFFKNGLINEIYFNILIPNDYKTGSILKPVVHWVSENSGSGFVKWELEFTISNVEQVFPNTTIITANNIKNLDGVDTSIISNKHLLTIFPDINISTLDYSSILICRLYRDGVMDTFDEDVGFLKFELNYQIDKNGLETIHGT